MVRYLMKPALVLALLASPVSPALAHIALEVKEAKTGTSYKAVFRVPHGCEGSATTSISIEIPEGLIGVKPMPKPGWTIALERGPYARAYKHYHGDMAEGVRRVTWTGGPLPDEHFDEFALNGFVARELAGVEALHFPVRQICEAGEIYWAELPKEGQDAHALEHPAATLKLVAANNADHRHGAAVSQKTGAIAIDGAWARATPPGAKAAAGYVSVTNNGSEPDRLVEAELTGAGEVEMHETLKENGVVRMREREGGIEIAPGQTISFAPGGLHLMFLELSGPLADGTEARGTLRFEKAGEVAVTFPIRRDPPDEASHHQH